MLTHEQCLKVIINASSLLYDYCKKANIHYVIAGISGGLDSAVTLGLAARARDKAAAEGYILEPIAVIMPCQSNQLAEEYANLAIRQFKTQSIKVELTDIYNNLFNIQFNFLNEMLGDIMTEVQKDFNNQEFDKAKKITQGNIKARLRMITVYHIARILNGIVLSTDNLSELWMGFWTINGDVGDFGMIQKILKGSELYEIAKELGVPDEIIQAKPDDGLGVANGDADQLGAEYQDVDKIMITLINNGFNPNGHLNQLDNLPAVTGIDPKIVLKIAARSLYTAYKRIGTVNLSRKQLGLPPIKQ